MSQTRNKIPIAKCNQTYEWALAQMREPGGEVRLRNIAKRFHTEELMRTALIFGHAKLQELPRNMLTRDLCKAALENSWTEFYYVPEELLDYDMLLDAVSDNPYAFELAFWLLRKNRQKEPFSAEDIRLAKEALYPEESCRARMRGKVKKEETADETEEETILRCVDNYGYSAALPRRLLYSVLSDALERMEDVPEHKGNTRVCYQYCDAGNFKTHMECVVRGTLTERQKVFIREALYDGEFFIPSAVGLPEEHPEAWDEDLDHVWFSLEDPAFEATCAEPTTDLSSDDLVEAFLAKKGKWEQVFEKGETKW